MAAIGGLEEKEKLRVFSIYAGKHASTGEIEMIDICKKEKNIEEALDMSLNHCERGSPMCSLCSNAIMTHSLSSRTTKNSFSGS